MPGAGSEGVPKICNMKMSPNAIPNNTSLAKDTIKSIHTPQAPQPGESFLCLELEVRGFQKFVT